MEDVRRIISQAEAADNYKEALGILAMGIRQNPESDILLRYFKTFAEHEKAQVELGEELMWALFDLGEGYAYEHPEIWAEIGVIEAGMRLNHQGGQTAWEVLATAFCLDPKNESVHQQIKTLVENHDSVSYADEMEYIAELVDNDEMATHDFKKLLSFFPGTSYEDEFEKARHIAGVD